MKLIITEKPSVAQSIAKVLNISGRKNGYLENNSYIISWCVGHLVELDKPISYGEKYKSWSELPIIPANWHYNVKENVKEQFDILKKLMSDNRVDGIICATDAGREGELIFRHVYNMAGCKKPFKRLWISSMEDSAVLKGFENLKNGSDYDNLYNSALCRERADWLVGMNATRHYTNLYGRLLNIGRVQTPTLAMIVERDNQISNFQKEKYYTAEINCGVFTAVTERIDDISEAEAIKNRCHNNSAVVQDVKQEQKFINPPKLYDLTSLQREANRLFGYTAQQTLEAAQSLYDKKLATYPRTDSQYLTEDMESTARELIGIIRPMFNCTAYEQNIRVVMNNKKVSDHHAIIPTVNIGKADLGTLSPMDRNILYMISNRLLTATSRKCIYEVTSAELNCAGTPFFAKGRVVKDMGWKEFEAAFNNRFKANLDESKEAAVLPGLCQGQLFNNVSSSVAEHYTQPPKPYTEDTLLSAMERAGNSDYDTDEVERKGLGTPATRAAIIEKIIKGGFAERRKKQIVSTEAGQNLIKVVPDNIKSAKMTADWENRLVLISKGQADSITFMNDIIVYVRAIVSNTQKNEAVTKAFEPDRQSGGSTAIGICPHCGGEIRNGKFGFYCVSKCGMNISKVYGKELTETQLKSLLSGKSVTYTNNGRKTVVLPEIEQNEYNGKVYHQWRTKKG